MDKIVGGYYIKARKIQESKIARQPPYVREIWDWLLKEANHTDAKINGTMIERGQLLRTFKDIQKGLYWMIGYRKMSYKKWQCEKSMKFLREQGMVTTMRTTRGILITIVNYDYYQTPKNYESNRKATARVTREQRLASTINKNGNNDKNVKNEKEDTLSSKVALIISYLNEKTGRNEAGQKPFDPKEAVSLLRARFNGGRTVKDCIDVIDIKIKDWLDDEKMFEYLRPSTLFRKMNFENYITKKRPDEFSKYLKKE